MMNARNLAIIVALFCLASASQAFAVCATGGYETSDVTSEISPELDCLEVDVPSTSCADPPMAAITNNCEGSVTVTDDYDVNCETGSCTEIATMTSAFVGPLPSADGTHNETINVEVGGEAHEISVMYTSQYRSGGGGSDGCGEEVNMSFALLLGFGLLGLRRRIRSRR